MPGHHLWCVSPRFQPQFRSMTYPTIDWKANEYQKLTEALNLLKAVVEREGKRHEMDQHLTPSMLALLEDEIIPMLENEIDYDPTPQYDPSLAGI